MGQFNLQKFISSVKRSEQTSAQVSSWLKNFGRQLQQKSLYGLGLFSEFQLTPDDTLLLGLDYTNESRGRAVLRHKVSISLYTLVNFYVFFFLFCFP